MLQDFPEMMRGLEQSFLGAEGMGQLLTDTRFLFWRRRESWKWMVVRVAQL